ncbi:MAG: diaminopimelate epimerase [Bacteroidota bacterium]|nr:diaminopimelate epimerase [Bacteroidota bacterium]
MTFNFSKYQGTGNDFILIDNRTLSFEINPVTIANLCHRRFGIGADGLMLLQNKSGYDFEMVYFNADGHESSMCGNGGRCIAAFASYLGIIKDRGTFWAIDGEHLVEIKENKFPEMIVSLKMIDVVDIIKSNDSYILNTGSPHYITFTNDVEKIDVIKQGKEIRNSSEFIKDGINVNFVEIQKNSIKMRTYERGVEDETFSCGTGATAAGIAAIFSGKLTSIESVPIQVSGGNLKVHFSKIGNKGFHDIWLEGPASFVFTGKIEV